MKTQSKRAASQALKPSEIKDGIIQKCRKVRQAVDRTIKGPEKPQRIVAYIPALAAALVCASKEDTRAYLKGVFLEWNEGQTAFVGTNGHQLCVATPSREYLKAVQSVIGIPTSGHRSIILAPADVKEILRWDCKGSLVVARFAVIELLKDGSFVAKSWDGKHTQASKGVDAQYPDYKKCMPKPDEKLVAAATRFNFSYLSDIEKIARMGFGA